MEIITGRTGEPHVYAIDDAEINKLFLGNGDFCLQTGNALNAQMNGTQEIRIYDGSIMMQGRLAKIRPADGYDSLSLDVGTVGYKRMDLIVAEYSKETTETQEEIEGEIKTIVDVIETVELKVIKGTPDRNNYVEPEIETADIDTMDDEHVHQMKLWAVKFDGINNAGLVDKRVFIYNSDPIQAALDYARSSIANIEAYVEQAISEISQGLQGLWRVSINVTGSMAQSAISVTMPSGYTEEVTDIVDVYLNGLKLEQSEYTATITSGATPPITITLARALQTFTGSMEVVVSRLNEGI